ncbi:interferon alpha/beta receptor 1a-like [Betta splendens]|uniref:Interferon alpha/beta receptor 1a-like n=1 Tax=Betta splendens TaxID=158456 RepID=A0A6P7LGD4_BETSP|nr:interferon alpha/beta receptor 1a-like [Betta splendens]
MFVLLLCIQLFGQVAAQLDPPQNVTLITLNTNYTLSWDWHQNHTVTFTTQYVGKHQLLLKNRRPKWLTACNAMPHRSCDLTGFNLNYWCVYMLRVRASMHGRDSEWVLKEFLPKRDAALGSPTIVNLVPARSDLDVFITDSVTSIRKVIPTLQYLVVYWERSAGAQNQTLTSNANIVTLPNLKAWTWYCVSVCSRADGKSSSFTSPRCMKTQGNVPWWQIFLYFLAVLAMCSLGLLLLHSFFRIFKTIKASFYPSNQLPPHLQKYLSDSPGFDVPGLFIPDAESELLCERVTVCKNPTFLKIYSPLTEALLVSPPGLEEDISGYSRQDSSCSGDSGVYSTGDSSNLENLKGKESS